MPTPKLLDDPLYRACVAVGGVAAVADRLGVKRQSVYDWIQAGRIPAKRVREFSHITGLPREQANPEYFGEAA